MPARQQTPHPIPPPKNAKNNRCPRTLKTMANPRDPIAPIKVCKIDSNMIFPFQSNIPANVKPKVTIKAMTRD